MSGVHVLMVSVLILGYILLDIHVIHNNCSVSFTNFQFVFDIQELDLSYIGFLTANWPQSFLVSAYAI